MGERKYARLRETGHSAIEIYRIAEEAGLDRVARIRLIREEFNLSLVAAKDVMVIAEGWANSLDAHQAQIAAELQQALDTADLDDDLTTIEEKE